MLKPHPYGCHEDLPWSHRLWAAPGVVATAWVLLGEQGGMLFVDVLKKP